MVAEYEPPRRSIEGQGLCLVIDGEQRNARQTVIYLERHLVDVKEWEPHPSGTLDDTLSLRLLQPGGRALVAGTVEKYLEKGPTSDDCAPLEQAMRDYPEAVYIHVYSWER